MSRNAPALKPNRRVRGGSARNHLLDVKIRTSTARRRRHEKVGRWLWNVILLGVIAGGSVYGVRAGLAKFFFNNPDYMIKRITLDLDNVMTREEALAKTGLQENTNIFLVDLAKVEDSLKTIPQVASVKVERELPDQIKIALTARQPIAWVTTDESGIDPTTSDKSFLVDGSGFLMRPRHMESDYFHLPAIYGVKSDNLRDGESVTSDDLVLALKFIDLTSKHPESLLHVRSLDVSKGYCIDVTNDTNAHILFGDTGLDEQLARLEKLLANCNESGRTLESVNLMVKRNTPVTFVSVAAAPQPEPKPAAPVPKTQKTKRN